MITCKWPGLWIEGKSITQFQAEEVILRTTNWNLSTNNYSYARSVAKELNVYSKENWPFDYEKVEELHKQYNVLNLDYFDNRVVASAWVYGPHGWCWPDGTIKSNFYNIGKWPSDEEVEQELTLIAEAFPFLDMRICLLSGEWGQDEWRLDDGFYTTDPGPLHITNQYVIKDGALTIHEPDGRDVIPSCPDRDFALDFSNPNREIGIPIGTLLQMFERHGWKVYWF